MIFRKERENLDKVYNEVFTEKNFTSGPPSINGFHKVYTSKIDKLEDEVERLKEANKLLFNKLNGIFIAVKNYEE